MTGQARKWSAVEAVAGTAVGFAVSIGISLVVYPAFGASFSLADIGAMTAIFTVASIARSYLLRRFFNWIHHREGS